MVALTHDWCKIGLYEVSERNVKDKNTGAWYQEPFYKINEHKPFPFGHGVNSMFVAQRFFHLPLNRH